jgi:hypothetical protein
MKASSFISRSARGIGSLALFAIAFCLIAFLLRAQTSSTATDQGTEPQEAVGAPAVDQQTVRDDAPDVAAFRQSVGGSITPLVIELRGEPGVLRKIAADKEGKSMSVAQIGAHSLALHGKQNEFLQGLAQRGVRAMMRRTAVPQINGSIRHIEYRFTYLLNGFLAFVATDDIERLRALPEVAHISEAVSPTYNLDKAIDYSLGTHTNAADRRTAVYGPTQEFQPSTADALHPETPRTIKVDGFEGQNMKVAVIDSGVDWRHPMFGGTGHTTPLPRVSGEPESPDDNRKVIYYYAIGSPGDPADDFGHGTHVASCVAGYSVDGTTAPRTGYGLGRDGTGVGPTINNAQLFGTAPQARIMAYKVCGPATNCFGDIELAMEDAASPVTIVGTGDGGTEPTTVKKPIADVINLSLSGPGDPGGSLARVANNAALAGTIVVASASNDGPGASTLGAPCVGTLPLCVAASFDPGSTNVSDVLAPDQVPADLKVAGSAGPPPERGAASNANASQPGERQAMKLFPVAGGGPLPEGSLSAHYVFVDRRGNPPPPVPSSVTNRIALVKGSGTFAQTANSVAPFNPAAILIITAVESATAVQVLQGIPTYTIGLGDGNYLIDKMSAIDSGDGDDNVDVPVGTISDLPLRIADSATLASFQPGIAGFSSRGPVAHNNGRFRMTKPDVTAPGVGVTGAATVEGIPEETVGMASLRGYVTVNGTSFSAPITAGGMALVRQYVRETLGLDETDSETDQAKTNWRDRRFDTVTVAKALIMNTATNLRSGFGVPQGDGVASAGAINEMGAGHINLAAALQGRAIMVAPTELLLDPEEFTGDDPRIVMVPSVSFGPVPIVNVNGTITRMREVVIRDVSSGAGGGGSGVYNLTQQNNRNADNPGFQISFTAADGSTPITSVAVPAGGEAKFFVRVVADGRLIPADPTEFQWYVTATSAGQTLRMPFYYRAVRPTILNITAPEQQALENTQPPSPTPTPAGCSVFDTDGNYTVKWTYTKPASGPDPAGFRVQEATRSQEIFFDAADEALVAGENSQWTGSDQWNTSINPETGSPAYFIPDAAEQNESLTMVDGVEVPPGGATLSFTTTQDTEVDFDFAHVDVSTDNINYVNVASFTGFFVGTRSIDISPYAGQTVRVRFRMQSDQLVPAPGWWVEDIRVSSDDFRGIADVGPNATSAEITGRFNGTYFYRIAGLFNNPIAGEPIVTGLYSNVRCVTVTGNPLPPPQRGLLQFSAATYGVGENAGNATITVVRSGGTAGTVTVDFATSNGSASAGTDYTASSGTLTFGPGEASKQFSVPIAEDTAVEGDETVNLTLSNPTMGAVLGAPVAAVLTIVDNDTGGGPGSLQFSAASYSEAENAGTATITVTRTGGSSGAVGVSYATSDGSANAGSDYTAASGTLSFATGETTKTFTVFLTDEPSAEPDETVILTLSNPTGGATLGSPASATLTILDTDRGGPPAQLLNISTRARVQAGDKVAIGGFIVTGSTPKRVLLRGIGPSLSVNGVPLAGRLQDPVLHFYDGNGVLITSNDNWKDSPAPERSEIQGSGLAPQNDSEAAIARTVNPGHYTGVLSGKNQSEGIGLVEVYDRDRGGESEMANISTRGSVETGDNVLIGGFIAGGRSGATNIIVRAIGPSLTGKGVPGALQDPTVELVNENGDIIDSSDDWETSPDQAEVAARGLAPQDRRESAALETVAPGNYTAIVRGKGGTGVGLVEVYNVK